MASPSERPEKARKDGIRCDGVFPESHKFAGEKCNVLLLEKDPELGVGARCGRCGTFHTLDRLFQRAVVPVAAAPDFLQSVYQRKNGEAEMTARTTSTKTARFLDALALQRRKLQRNLERSKRGDLSRTIMKENLRDVNQFLEFLDETGFDIDRFEEAVGVKTNNDVGYALANGLEFYLYIRSSPPSLLKYLVFSISPVKGTAKFLVREAVDGNTVFEIKDMPIRSIAYLERHSSREGSIPQVIIQATMCELPVKIEIDKEYFGLREDVDSQEDWSVGIRLRLRKECNSE